LKERIDANLNTLAGKRIATAECVMCMSEAATHALVPCGHLLFCHVCGPSTKVKTCPVCRLSITSVMKIFGQ
jgi:hypothetical protein